MPMMPEINFLRFFLAFGSVLGGLFILLWALKRLKIFSLPQKGDGRLKLLESLSLDTQRRLFLVSCDQDPVLILASPKGDQILPCSLTKSSPQSSIKKYLALPWVALTTIALCSAPAMAQSLSLDLGEGTAFHVRIVQILALLTIFSLAPSILVMVTSFTRIIVVLSLVRNALGLQNAPPNSVMISLALFLSFFVMSPVLEKSYQEGVRPYMEETLSEAQAWEKTSAPFHQFMMNHVRERDLRLFMDFANLKDVPSSADTPWRVLIPAFMISELCRAFEIGFLIFVPFLIIDMVVASVLMSMGMMMLPPITLSLPFKIIFFVLADGWFLLAGSLIRSYGGS